MPPLQEYLLAFVAMRRATQTPPAGYNYICAEEVVLEHGVSFESAPLTDSEMALLATALRRSPVANFKYKQCFYNAQLVAVSAHDARVQYYEGYAMGSTIPCLHGWLGINGKVIDVTWRTDTANHVGLLPDRIFGVLPSNWAYMGIPYDTAHLIERMGRTGLAASVLDDYTDGWPEFKRPRQPTPELAAALAERALMYKGFAPRSAP